MRRRDFLRLASGTVALGAPALAAPNIAGAQAPWPDKPVRIIVPFAAGGGTDLVARPWADKLSQAFRQQFIVENRGGASGLIGAEAAAKSAPDGYTFLVAAATSVITVPLLRKVPYDHTSFQAVGRLGDIVCGFVVHPSIGATTFKDAIDYAKKNPGKMAFGSSGGTVPHMRFEMLKFRTGVDILHVPYRGGADSLQDLLPGNIHMMNEPNTLPHVKAGKLHLVCVNHTQRMIDFPDAPTLTELGFPGSDVPLWFCLWAPGGTPKEIINKLNANPVTRRRGENSRRGDQINRRADQDCQHQARIDGCLGHCRVRWKNEVLPSLREIEKEIARKVTLGAGRRKSDDRLAGHIWPSGN